MNHRFLRYPVLARMALLLASACSTASTEPEPLEKSQSAITLPMSCNYPSDCDTGDDCVNNRLPAPCTHISQCDNGYACNAGYCTLPCGLFVNWGPPDSARLRAPPALQHLLHRRHRMRRPFRRLLHSVT